MNKQFAYLILCFSCLVMVMSSCKDDDEEPIGNDRYNALYPFNGLVASEGGTIGILWRKGIAYDFKFQTSGWKVGLFDSQTPIPPYEELETAKQNDTIRGEWFTVTPIVSGILNGRKYYNGIKVELSPNMTGKKRSLIINNQNYFVYDAYVFQECEELPAAPEDSNED